MINVGVIGLGRVVTEFHIPSLLRMKEVKIKGICARAKTKERLSLASGIGANFYQDYQEMFEEENLNAVYICSPTVFHKEMTVTALKRGYHVFCEKPIAMNVDEAKAMCNEARRNSHILFIGHNRRFSPTYQKVKKFSEERRINILLLEKIRGAFVNIGKTDYNQIAKKENELLGPEIMEFGVHFVDLAKWICGKVTKAYFSSNKIPEVPACAGNGIAVFEHKEGQKSIMYFTLAGGKSSERSVAIADDSTCETFGGMFGKSQVIITRGNRVEKFQSSDDTLVGGGFLQESRCFIDSVLGEKKPFYEPEDTIDTLRLSLEWAESYKVPQER
ncbi:MAG: Gfo/Idh/MocA family protein [bacterium]